MGCEVGDEFDPGLPRVGNTNGVLSFLGSGPVVRLGQDWVGLVNKRVGLD